MKIEKIISITIIVFIVHSLLHEIQIMIYDGNFLTDKINTIAYSLYIPHGSRILLFLIYGYKSIPGLIIAHVFNGVNNDNFELFNLTFYMSSFVASLSVPAGGYLIRVYNKDVINYSGFEIKYLNLITIISSFINAALSNLIRYFTIFDKNFDRFYNELIGYIVGDCLGVIVIILSYLFLKRIFYLSIQK